MISQDLEFLISQYADGTLDPAKRPEVEAALRDSAEARQFLAELQMLDTALRSAVPAIPELDWEQHASEISAATAGLAPSRPDPTRIAPFAWQTKLAMAASILLAVGLSILATHDNPGLPQQAGNSELTRIDVRGPAADSDSASPSTEPSLVDISIGPPPLATAGADASPFAQDIVWRPARVTIDVASAVPSGDRIVH